MTNLSTMKDATRTIVEQGAQEDVPTGTTPRKRAIEVIDQWPLTSNRETILKASREKPASSVAGSNNLLVLNENHPPEAFAPDADELGASESPLSASLASSVSSSSETPRPAIPQPSIPLKKTIRGGPQKSGLSTMGTLTDHPTNIITSRRPRRAR
jgi:kinesin family member 11